ncbi:MAG: hypothetical protein RJA76_688 [Bacteroidota bacterium]|jgi:alkane 1-monooxygenase
MISFIRPFQYASTFILFALGFISFSNFGLLCWVPFLFTFFLVPGIELFIAPDAKNLSEVEEQIEKSNLVYDLILYLVLPLQIIALWEFLTGFSDVGLTKLDVIGRIITMGLLCSIFGINVAHELGHRNKIAEKTMAKILLLSSLYMHFFIEHNKGHHRMVGTANDPSTAKLNQSVYRFYIQTFIGTYLHAWKIAIEESKKKKNFFPILFNQMMLFQFIQLALLVLIGYKFGVTTTCYFICSALLGSLMLETVNYIEHYGLSRKMVREGVYERVQSKHSWNSNHVVGRLLLFELSRHSDHHYLASKKYQLLKNLDDAPQMPTGYPGMILLSLIPPLWFKVMHGQMRKYQL